MAISNIVVNVVDVGQGQCTFVEVYDGDSLVNTLLFDCGSSGRSPQTLVNLEYVANKVKDREGGSGVDLLVFSHSDADHINLMWRFLKLFGDDDKPSIGSLYYGGERDWYKKSKGNIINYLVDNNYCTEEEVHSPPPEFTNYNLETGTWGYIWNSETLYVSILAANVIGNTPLSRAGNVEGVLPTGGGEPRNRVSLVCGIFFGGSSFVITGDATSRTFGAINATVPINNFPNNLMMTLPHHGSRETSFGVSSSTAANSAAQRNVRTFRRNLDPIATTASAKKRYYHPSFEVMNAMAPKLSNYVLEDERLNNEKSHLVTAYVDMELVIRESGGATVPRSRYTTLESERNVFSTLYYYNAPAFGASISPYAAQLGRKFVDAPGGLEDVAINSHASWKWNLQSNGTYTYSGHQNLTMASFTTQKARTALAERMARVERTNGGSRLKKNAPRKALKSNGISKKIKSFN